MLQLSVFFGLLILTSVMAEINYEIFADSDYPNQCVLRTPERGVNVVIDNGQSRRHPSKCSEIVCGRNGWALVYSCNPRSPPDGCEFTDYINFNASYPKCCKRALKCNDVKSNDS
ncbi:uncharacterized protein LOC26530327 isoform X2 [Drosophila willistoni]|nr:uncharacterized protein LOC26530327 isoform X2 [Drosophila willistoni]